MGAELARSCPPKYSTGMLWALEVETALPSV